MVVAEPDLSSDEGHDNLYSLLTLDDWISKFGRIYGKRHDKHTTEYLISRLVEEVAELVNPMESQDQALIGSNLADVFSWTCSISYKLNINLSALAWQKYGTNAPRPSWSQSLQPSLSEFSAPQTLHEWQEFISKLYQSENARLTPMNGLVAMMKDVGDLAMLHRKRAPLDQITSKLAAILAWTLTIAQLLKLDLAKVVHEKYDDKCPVCLQSICDTDVCHPFSVMYVSFSDETADEEKYVVFDLAAKLGFKTLVNPSPNIQNTRDLSTSLDLINKSDSACILLSGKTTANKFHYRQVFEALSCFSILSKGNVWIFAKGNPDDFSEYINRIFSAEKVAVIPYQDAGHLRALFERELDDITEKRKELAKRY